MNKPKFQLYEKVRLQDGSGTTLDGQVGAVIGRCVTYELGRRDEPTERNEHWTYVICFDRRQIYASVAESELIATGELDRRESFLGTVPEISYDVVNPTCVAAMEGCFRLPGRPWEVFVTLEDRIDALEWKRATWPNGVTGIKVRVPESANMDTAAFERALAEALGVPGWKKLEFGPDSLCLRADSMTTWSPRAKSR